MENEKMKRYDLWNERKKLLDQDNFSDKLYFKEGDIWWCSLGLNIGSESFGKGESFRRPILIIKKLSKDLCISISLTTKKKQGTWFTDIILQDEVRYAMLYQIRTLNKKRFQHKIGELNSSDLTRVKEKLEELLELSPNHHSTFVEIEGNNIPKVIIIYQNEELESSILYEEYEKIMNCD